LLFSHADDVDAVQAQIARNMLTSGDWVTARLDGVAYLEKAPPGQLIVDRHYYTFSPITFYTNRNALILNGRYFNLEYGSYAPGAPNVFIDDLRFKNLWLEPQRCYLVAYRTKLKEFEELVGHDHVSIVAAAGGKLILTNHSW
jgi:hypothetical protein